MIQVVLYQAALHRPAEPPASADIPSIATRHAAWRGDTDPDVNTDAMQVMPCK